MSEEINKYNSISTENPVPLSPNMSFVVNQHLILLNHLYEFLQNRENIKDSDLLFNLDNKESFIDISNIRYEIIKFRKLASGVGERNFIELLIYPLVLRSNVQKNSLVLKKNNINSLKLYKFLEEILRNEFLMSKFFYFVNVVHLSEYNNLKNVTLKEVKESIIAKEILMKLKRKSTLPLTLEEKYFLMIFTLDQLLNQVIDNSIEFKTTKDRDNKAILKFLDHIITHKKS
jgi:hypothetical protein